MSGPQFAPLGESYPQADLDGDGCPVIRADEPPSMYARKQKYRLPAEAREELMLEYTKVTYALISLMRRNGLETMKVLPQEVNLARHIGSRSDIDDDGGLTVQLNDGMGS